MRPKLKLRAQKYIKKCIRIDFLITLRCANSIGKQQQRNQTVGKNYFLK